MRMSQCEKKSMVVQGIKDRSKIREDEVIRKQGCGDEGETREAKEGELGKGPGDGCPRVEGEIWGVRCSGVPEVSIGKRERGGRVLVGSKVRG